MDNDLARNEIEIPGDNTSSKVIQLDIIDTEPAEIKKMDSIL